MMRARECLRVSWVGHAFLAGLAVSTVGGCDRTQGRTENASGPRLRPQALHEADAGPAWERSVTRFQLRPCEGETAIPDDAERVLTERGSATREHCELHALGPDGARRLFVRTMNTIAHDDEGNRLPACIWEVFAVAPQPVSYLGALYVCEFAVKDGCIYDLDQTPEPSAPTACIGVDGRLAEPSR
jgi:hypothetical protein